MKTVVTGGAGFIGSHLVRRLVADGRKVVVASDFSRLGADNLPGLGMQPADIELREADLSDYPQAVKAVSGGESIFHLAARVGSLVFLHGNETAELVTLQSNLIIDANVFRACLEAGVKKLVYASSCAVYPMDRQSAHGAVFAEDDLQFPQKSALTPTLGHWPINPDGGYGWAKLIGEVQLGWMENINIGIARIFNIYGENEPLEAKAHVIGDLIRKMILQSQGELVVRGDGKQSRDFLYVSDCIEALLKLEEKAANPPVTVNIGSGQPTSIDTVAQKAMSISGKRIKITYDTTKPVGPLSRTADISKAKALLGWEPKVDLDEGLRRTYTWAEKRLNAE